MDPLPDPHDRLFRLIFGDPEQAAELLRLALPTEVMDLLDADSLRRVPGSFVDEDLRRHHTDLLFSARIDSAPALVYLLFEHKSGEELWAPLQMLGYVVRVLEDHLRKRAEPRRLPLVIPILFHHGPRPWRAPRKLSELYELEHLLQPQADQLRQYLPELALQIHELGADEQQFTDHALSVVAELSIRVLRRARSLDLSETERLLRSWRATIPRLLAHRRGSEALAALYSYLLNVVPCEHHELNEAARRVFTAQIRNIMKTPAEQIRHRAHLELLVRMLESRFGPLDDAAQRRLQEISPEQLTAIADRALTAQTLAEALGEPA